MPILATKDHDFFHRNGYLVVRNLMPRENCDAVISALWEFLGMSPEEPEDWYRPPLKPGGMIEIYQHQAMWNCRQHPRLHQAFSELFGSERLWVSIDRANFKPPPHPDHPDYDHRGFIHWDTDSTKPHTGLHVQGVLYLADTAANQGGFQCVPELYRTFDTWVQTQPEDRNPFVPDLTRFEVTPIAGEAGDFVIWNVMQPHGNGRNLADKPRFAQFISMYPAPAEGEAEERRAERVRCWKEHAPPGNKTFPGDARRIEEETFPTADLTPLGRKLLGADTW